MLFRNIYNHVLTINLCVMNLVINVYLVLKELKTRSESSSELDEISSRNMPFIAGANIKV